jgi:hypothetical protein
MSRLVPTLVYGDLRGAGHELLSRGDLDLRWALTLHEAMAVSRSVKIDLVLASDHFAFAYLKARAELPDQPPCIVLIGPSYLDQKDELQAAGATALVSASDPNRIVEAISELTGLTFRDYPRVPLHTVVDVQFKGYNQLLYTFDLSTSGVSIRELKDAQYGDRARLTFDLFDPPLTVETIVVRSFNIPEARCTGLCFVDLSEADKKRIAELVKTELATMPMFTTADITDAPGEQTMDILTALREKSDAGLSEYMSMVTGIVDGWDDADAAPSWVFEVAGKLTDTERKALSSGKPLWAKAAVEMRLELKRQVVDKTSSGEYAEALEFCRAMANDVSQAPIEEAVDATTVRSALLRAIYVLHRTMKERDAQKARNKSKKKK